MKNKEYKKEIISGYHIYFAILHIFIAIVNL
jgi:hypothetical protein